MSIRTDTSVRGSTALGDGVKKTRPRWPIYAGLAVILVLVFAYFDAGEEPLHPIEQRIALPASDGVSN